MSRPFLSSSVLVAGLLLVAGPGIGPGPAAALETEYWSDQFVLLAEDGAQAPLLVTLDFNRGTSDIPGRERVAEFVGQMCEAGRWFDLGSGEYPYPGQDMGRLVGNGVCRIGKPKGDQGWILDYDGTRAGFRIESEPEVLLHVQRDDPELRVRHSAAKAVLEFGKRRYPATLFREEVRWYGYNRMVGRTPQRMYGHFDWAPFVSRRGDWFLLVQDPGQARVPEDGPDHNWGVYRSPEGVVRPLAAVDFRIRPERPIRQVRGRQAPSGFAVEIGALGMQGFLHDRGHFLDRFGSGMYAVRGELYMPGAGRRTVYGLVDHIEH